MKIINPHPIPFRFANYDDAMKAMELMHNRKPFKHLSVPPYRIEGDNVVIVTDEYEKAPYELSYIQLEDGEKIPKYLPKEQPEPNSMFKTTT